MKTPRLLVTAPFMKKFAPLIALTSVHLVTTIAALAVAIGYVLSRATSAAPASPVGEIAGGLFRVFRYPIPVFVSRYISYPQDWVYFASFALNSFVWAAAIVWLADKIDHLRKHKTA